MFLKEFNQNGREKIAKVNKFLKEEFNMAVLMGFPARDKLVRVKEKADMALVKIKGSGKQFHLQPEYAKYLGIRDVATTMLNEGMYAESPAYMEMKDALMASVQQLMDSGYTIDEASKECMNRYRMDNRFAYDDEHVLPIVLKAAKDYFESSCSSNESLEEIVEEPETDLNEFLLRELAKECGVELSDSASLEAIEEKLGMFAQVSGKSRDAVVGFLNGLEEDAVGNGIKFFGAKIKEANKFVDARRKAIAAGDDEFEVDGKTYKVTGDTSDEKKNESMFDDIIDNMLAEELEGTSVEEAEVVMAVRALADDIQDQVERLGRMVNEDIPAIADQMIHEFGAQRAQQFKDSADQVLQAALEGAKAGKEGINGLVGEITGEPIAGAEMGLGDTGELAEPSPADAVIDDMPEVDPAMDVNEPAAAGPEEEPMGRAPVEV
jgi:hypothetical protein